MTTQIATYFTKNENNLKNIVLRAGKLRRIEQLFLKNLDPSLRKHLKLAALEGQSALIFTDSPGRAHQLRYSSQQILAVFASLPETRHINKIQIKTGYWPENEGTKIPTGNVLGAPRDTFAAQRQRLKAAIGKPGEKT